MHELERSFLSRSDDLLERFEELLLKKERVIQLGAQYEHEWTVLFGSLLVERFEAEIEVIQKKKEISLYVAAINRGEIPDPQAIEDELSDIMERYFLQLDDMKARVHNAENSNSLTAEEALEVRRIFRRMAKRIHPDLHEQTQHDPRLKELWLQLLLAYHHNQLQDLRDIELLILSYLNERPELSEEELPDLQQRIDELEEEIAALESQDPFALQEWLFDAEKVKEYKQSLRQDIELYRTYAQELEQHLSTLLSSEENVCQMN